MPCGGGSCQRALSRHPRDLRRLDPARVLVAPPRDKPKGSQARVRGPGAVVFGSAMVAAIEYLIARYAGCIATGLDDGEIIGKDDSTRIKRLEPINPRWVFWKPCSSRHSNQFATKPPFLNSVSRS